MHVRSRSVLAREALVRSTEPGLERPDDLIAAAEVLGKVPELGRAIRTAIAPVAAATPPATATFVNVHADELEDNDLLSSSAPLSRHAKCVVLEVTERASLEGRNVSERIRALRAMGYRFALDDLGVGYAGLSWLMLLRPEYVKLDLSLVRDIDRDPTQHTIVGSVITLCRELGIRVIAEGVERVGQMTTLDSIGCELMQGFLFARPGSPNAAIQWPKQLPT